MFLGLTLILLIALGALIIRAKKLEKEQAIKPVEIVQKSPSTAIRALAPQDLEVTRSKMQLAEENQNLLSARHEIEIRNNGNTRYGEIQLRFTYYDRRGRMLLYKSHTIGGGIMPGATLELTGIVFHDLPTAVHSCRVSIDYAELPSVAQ